MRVIRVKEERFGESQTLKDKEQAAVAARFKKTWSDPSRDDEKHDSQTF